LACLLVGRFPAITSACLPHSQAGNCRGRRVSRVPSCVSRRMESPQHSCEERNSLLSKSTWRFQGFPPSCPVRKRRYSVSSSRPFARSVRISRTALLHTLHQGLEALSAWSNFRQRLSVRDLVPLEEPLRPVQPFAPPPFPAKSSVLASSRQVSPDLLLYPEANV
jgi:hypothetical protein